MGWRVGCWQPAGQLKQTGRTSDRVVEVVYTICDVLKMRAEGIGRSTYTKRIGLETQGRTCSTSPALQWLCKMLAIPSYMHITLGVTSVWLAGTFGWPVSIIIHHFSDWKFLL